MGHVTVRVAATIAARGRWQRPWQGPGASLAPGPALSASLSATGMAHGRRCHCQALAGAAVPVSFKFNIDLAAGDRPPGRRPSPAGPATQDRPTRSRIRVDSESDGVWTSLLAGMVLT